MKLNQIQLVVSQHDNRQNHRKHMKRRNIHSQKNRQKQEPNV